MDREILFRGKRADNGEWVEGYYAALPTDEGEPEHIIVETFDDGDVLYHFPPVDPSTVGQYTGFKDRNGKLIFEGDVVEYMGVGWEEPEMVRAVVVWEDGGWMVQESDCFYPNPMTESYEAQTTVVGNIHDNPEMVEV